MTDSLYDVTSNSKKFFKSYFVRFETAHLTNFKVNQ